MLSITRLQHMRNSAMGIMLIVLPLVATAQPKSGEENVQLFAKGACPSYVEKLNREPILADTLRRRQVSSEAMCACISAKFTSDKKLVSALNVDDAQLSKLFQSKKFEAYMMTRLMHSGLVCLAPELEAALNADTP